MNELKLFMILLGCRPPGRHTEQHDIFFGIARNLKELIPNIKNFWPEAASKIHIDAWREVTSVDGHAVEIKPRPALFENTPIAGAELKLFFINLGGYQRDVFGEQHYMMITAQRDKMSAMKFSKDTTFFKHNHFDSAVAHIDDKYGIDVDDIYEIDEILSSEQKERHHIALIPKQGLSEDSMQLGYLKLSSL